jgi:hypothetical protein
VSAPVHLSDEASQPHVRIACDGSWDTPKWSGQPEGLPDGVYLRDDGRLYAFERGAVTCPACLTDGAAS